MLVYILENAYKACYGDLLARYINPSLHLVRTTGTRPKSMNYDGKGNPMKKCRHYLQANEATPQFFDNFNNTINAPHNNLLSVKAL